MSEAMRLYGTEAPDLPSERISIGDLSFSIQDGSLRHICWVDHELIRAIAFLVRDPDWGTLAPTLTEVSRIADADGDSIEVTFKAVYQSGGAQLDVDLSISADSEGLSFRAEGKTSGAFETNRTGFTVLHPASVAGCSASVTHSDGSIENTHFPVLINPWQPFMDIVSLTHRRDGLAVTCAFEGDCFEMEDQRQWGDASFKTYVRPLALPWPYKLEKGEPLTQAVNLSWRDASAEQPAVEVSGTAAQADITQQAAGVVFPETALVLTAADAERLAVSPEDIAAVAPQRLLCHIDTSLGDVEVQIASFAALSKVASTPLYDVELVCAFNDPPEVELPYVRQLMDAHDFRPTSVLVCPAVDRQSTPPGSEWPDCPPLELIHQVSREVFGDFTIGGGMVSLFTELNRKRPPVEMLDFVSHGLCPIVHAADDFSVMETLETIPHITCSARAIMGGGEYRIGPATIAMRQNPYGNRTIPNPDLQRICVTDDDPRHRAQFGAAYVVGLACALAPAGVSVWTPSAVYGPRGLSGPIVAAITALAACAGEPVQQAVIANGLATLQLGDKLFRANLTNQVVDGLAAYEWTVA